MSVGDLAVYRAPASGLVLADALVVLDPWRCRWFGHRLRGRYEREPSGDFFERTAAERGERFYEVVSYPSRRVHPGAFECIWCERCGREWKREEGER